MSISDRKTTIANGQIVHYDYAFTELIEGKAEIGVTVLLPGCMASLVGRADTGPDEGKYLYAKVRGDQASQYYVM